MDHHGWDEWPSDDHDLGDAETADLGEHDDLLGGHLGTDPLGTDPDDGADLWPHEGYDAPDDLGADGLSAEGLGSEGLGSGGLGSQGHHGFGVDAHVDEPLDTGAGHDDGTSAAPSDHQPLGYDTGDARFGHAGDVPPDPVFGADPDAPGHDADGWSTHEFPPLVDLGNLPDPIDGPPWTDATLLGGEPLAELADHAGLPSPADLLGYAGLDVPDGDPWAALRAAEDPAASALARWWSPGT